MEDSSWLNSMRKTIDNLTVGKLEEMNHVRILLNIPAEDFEALLSLINRSTYSRMSFKVMDTDVELSKGKDDLLEVRIVMANAHGEVTLQFLFGGNEQGCDIEK